MSRRAVKVEQRPAERHQVKSTAIAVGLMAAALVAAGCAEGATAARIESCVEATKFGAFVGDAAAIDMWNAAGQSDEVLRSTCETIADSDPSRLEAMSADWDATQRAVRAAEASAPTTAPDRRCDPSYPAMCIRMDEPDLDCSNVGATQFPVAPPDRHGFDTDGDGFGCVPGADTG